MPYDEVDLLERPKSKMKKQKGHSKINRVTSTLQKIRQWKNSPSIIGIRLKTINCPKLLEKAKEEGMELHGKTLYYNR